MLSFASANIFTDAWDFITGKQKPEPYKPYFNISDDFNTKKLDLDKSVICVKDLNDNTKLVKIDKCDKNKSKYTLIDISNSNYFHTNSEGITRFNNE